MRAFLTQLMAQNVRSAARMVLMSWAVTLQNAMMVPGEGHLGSHVEVRPR